MKFIAPSKDEIPAKCKLKIAKSTEALLCPTFELNGGYNVHPAPTPWSINLDNINKINDATNNQKLTLFKRGKAISGAPIINGINQFPNPPIIAGITIKKIIISACEVIKTLYN